MDKVSMPWTAERDGAAVQVRVDAWVSRERPATRMQPVEPAELVVFFVFEGDRDVTADASLMLDEDALRAAVLEG